MVSKSIFLIPLFILMWILMLNNWIMKRKKTYRLDLLVMMIEV